MLDYSLTRWISIISRSAPILKPMFLILLALLISSYSLTFAITDSRKDSQSKIDAKISQLIEWTRYKTIININNYDIFNTYLRTKPRNYSVILMLTALKKERGCGVCGDARDEFKIVADSYRFVHGHQFYAGSNKMIFFSIVDFDEGGEKIFQALHLNTAPVFIHYPSVGKPKTHDKLDVSRQGFHAEAISKWIHEVAGINVKIYRPPNYGALMSLGVLLVAIMFGGYWFREQLESLYNPIYWAMISIIVVLIMISGQMWNQIRGPPFVYHNPNTGETGFFSGSSHFQFIAETLIVFVLYGAVTLGLILINYDLLPIKRGEIAGFGTHGILAVIGLVLFVFVFAYLLSIFRMKYQGYPYSFLF